MDKQNINRGRIAVTQDEVVAATTKAAEEIEHALAELPLNDAWTVKERQVALGYSHIPNEALELALGYLARNPGRFSEFDQEVARNAVAYATAMAPVANLADELSSRVRTSIRMQRMLPLAQVCALYGSMKAMNRHDGSLTDIVRKLGALLRTRKGAKRGTTSPTEPTGTVPAASDATASAHASGSGSPVLTGSEPSGPAR